MSKKRTGRVGRPPGPAPDPAERRALLVDAAVRTIRRVGPGASMEEIAAEAGLSKPILYSHFGDKSGLTAALLDSFTTELAAAIIAPLTAGDQPRALVRSAIDAFVAFIERDPDVYRFIARGQGGAPEGAVGHRMVSGVGDRLATVLAGALERVGRDPEVAAPWAYSVLGSVFMAAEWWLGHPEMTRDDLVGVLTDVVWGGLEGAGLGALSGPIAGPAAEEKVARAEGSSSQD